MTGYLFLEQKHYYEIIRLSETLEGKGSQQAVPESEVKLNTREDQCVQVANQWMQPNNIASIPFTL